MTTKWLHSIRSNFQKICFSKYGRSKWRRQYDDQHFCSGDIYYLWGFSLIIGISGWLDACNDGWKWYGNTDLTEENDTQDTDNDDRILIPQIHPT